MQAKGERERERVQSQPGSVETKHFQTNHHWGLHTRQLVPFDHVVNPDKKFALSNISRINVNLPGAVSIGNYHFHSSPYITQNSWAWLSTTLMKVIIPKGCLSCLRDHQRPLHNFTYSLLDAGLTKEMSTTKVNKVYKAELNRCRARYLYTKQQKFIVCQTRGSKYYKFEHIYNIMLQHFFKLPSSTRTSVLQNN